MTVLVYVLAVILILAMANIHILIKEVKVLKKEMLQVRSMLRRRQAGQSWEEIGPFEEDKKLMDKFFNRE